MSRLYRKKANDGGRRREASRRLSGAVGRQSSQWKTTFTGSLPPRSASVQEWADCGRLRIAGPKDVDEGGRRITRWSRAQHVLHLRPPSDRTAARLGPRFYSCSTKLTVPGHTSSSKDWRHKHSPRAVGEDGGSGRTAEASGRSVVEMSTRRHVDTSNQSRRGR